MLRIAVVIGLAVCAACTTPETAADTNPAMPQDAMPGRVTDLSAFDAFVALRPTPDQFRARYPDVRLVLPGEIATKELRMDNSRYFASLDAEGRIDGGKFQ